MITGKTIAKGALVVMAATLLSRFFGFLRVMVVARYFGSTVSTDAYLVAFSVPSGIAMAIAAAISAGFIPVFNSYLVQGQKETAMRVVNILLNMISVILVIIVIPAMIYAPHLVGVLAPGFGDDSVRLTVEMIRIMFPAMVFASLIGMSSGYLNSHQHFLFPALAPMVTSLAVIGSAVMLRPVWGIKGLAFGTMVGLTGQFLIQIPVMYKKGFRYKADFSVMHPGVVKALKLMAPVLIASLAPPFMILVERALASNLAVGSISSLEYAFRLMQLPLGLFLMAVSVPLFPAFSAYAAQKDYDKLKNTLVKGISALAIIMIPATAGLIALDVPIIRVLFERGAFGAKDTVPAAYALSFYALALFPLAARDIFRRGFYALHDSITPVIITLVVVALNVMLDIVLVKIMGIGGLALGAALSAFVEAVVLFMLINNRLHGLAGRSFAALLAKLVAASVIMGIVVNYCSTAIGLHVDLATSAGRIIQVVFSVGIGLVVFTAILVSLKVKELSEGLEMIKGFFKKTIK